MPACRQTIVGAVVLVQRLGQCGEPNSPLTVRDDRLRGGEAEVAQREIDGVVPLLAHQHADAWRGGQAVALQVPSHLIKDTCPSGSKAGEVRHGAAGGEADGGSLGQAE